MKKTMLPAISALILCMGTGCGILTVNGGGFVHEYHEEYCGNNTANTEVPPAPAEQPAVTEPAVVPEDWRLILVNRNHAVPENYELKLLELSNGKSVDERIYPDLQAMFDAARSEGYAVKVGEGYRTHEEQTAMMEQKIQEYRNQGCTRSEAERAAADTVAKPGTSEHELGLAVDINSDYGADPWGLYSWLADNAWKYGFILRYPQGCESITGIEYEPWHYRYVGKEAAAEIQQQHITLEEYLS